MFWFNPVESKIIILHFFYTALIFLYTVSRFIYTMPPFIYTSKTNWFELELVRLLVHDRVL